MPADSPRPTMRIVPAAFAALVFVCNAPAAEGVDYTRDVKPILKKNCTTCHGGAKQRSGLRLDTARGALQGGNAGPAVVPGKSDTSRLIHAVTGTHNVVAMPPKGKPRLSAAEIALLKRWIDDGAHAPANEVAETTAPKRKHWAFQPP